MCMIFKTPICNLFLTILPKHRWDIGITDHWHIGSKYMTYHTDIGNMIPDRYLFIWPVMDLSKPHLSTCSHTWTSLAWRLSFWIRETKDFSGMEVKSCELKIFSGSSETMSVQNFWSSERESYLKLVWYIKPKFCSTQFVLFSIKKIAND